MKVKGQMNMKKDEPAWKTAYENSNEEMKNWMERFAESYEKNPEELLELLRFGSQFYQYSVKNTTLIFLQNPNVTYVQSFAAWKKMGANIRKGQKGLKVYVPKQVTYLCTDPPVQLKDATKEQKAAYKEELAADMVSIMMTYRFDLEPTESRRRHFVEHYRRVDPGRIESVLGRVFETYRTTREKLEAYEEKQKNSKVRKEQDYERTVKTSI